VGEAEAPVWTYEKRLEFAAPVDRAWALFTDPAETRAWLLPFEENASGEQEAVIEGQPPVLFHVLEVDKERLLRTAMSGGNLPGRVETTTAFESTARGSRASITHQGFGDADAWVRFGDSFAQGWEEATTDLMTYVRTGVKLPRHIDDRRASIAAWPVRREWGVELADVFPGGFADQAGVKPGDILLKLDRMGVYNISDVWAFTRARAAGELVHATFIHAGELRQGEGRLSRFEDFGE
jgi:uncharacterized protein YndB with AHSA1/START domain